MQDLYPEGDKTLIIRGGAVLPPICLATGASENLIRVKRKESWAPSWLLNFGALIYMLVQKNERIEYYLEQSFANSRTGAIILNWCIVVTAFVGAMFAFSSETYAAVGGVLLLLGFIAPLVIYFVKIQFYTITKIDRGYVWMKFRKPELRDQVYNAYMLARGGTR